MRRSSGMEKIVSRLAPRMGSVRREAGKSLHCDLTLTFWTSCHDSSSKCEHCGWMIISRIAVREIPANRRLASHERIGNYFRCVSEYRELCLYRFRRLELVFACKGGDFQVAVASEI